jgi:hypothetical protein
MNIRFLAFLLINLSSFTFSATANASCHYELNLSKTKIYWTAYKTPKKVGVKVNFDKFNIQTNKASTNSIDSLVQDASFEVDALTVNSNNPERDAKLKSMFFSNNNSPLTISGQVVSKSKDKIEVDLKLNGNSRKISMAYSITENLFKATGKIDVLDFALGENLKKLNDACKIQHDGKTWSDVEIVIESEFDKKC